MGRLLKILVLALFLLSVAVSTAAVPSWETVGTEEPIGTDVDKIEVIAKDGYIYVATSKPITIKVFSIVGRLISEGKLPAGISRLKLSARGIYILQTGDTTHRVTI